MSFRLLRYHHFDIMRTLCFVTLAVLIVTVTSRAPRDPNSGKEMKEVQPAFFSLSIGDPSL